MSTMIGQSLKTEFLLIVRVNSFRDIILCCPVRLDRADLYASAPMPSAVGSEPLPTALCKDLQFELLRHRLKYGASERCVDHACRIATVALERLGEDLMSSDLPGAVKLCVKRKLMHSLCALDDVNSRNRRRIWIERRLGRNVREDYLCLS